MTSNEDLARRVRDHDEALRAVMNDRAMGPSSELATYSRRENWREVAGQKVPTPGRRELIEFMVASRLSEFPQLRQERKAIVLAGPPGAGKGYVTGNLLENAAWYVQCDPDEFKVAIVRHELEAGRLDALKTDLVRSYEAQGHVFAPMEFASLVHEESSAINARLQSSLLRDGSNLIFDTVLGSHGKAEELARTLDRTGYTFEVVSVQTTPEISRASRHDRWREPYELFLQGQHALGGRPVPSEFANDLFPPDRGPSLPEQNALWLAENAPGCVRYRVFRRTDAAAGHALEIDKTRSEPGAPLLSAAEAKARQAAIFGRQQNGPQRSVGRERGTGPEPGKSRGLGPQL